MALRETILNREAIGLHHSAVVVLMGLAEFYGHRQLIVEVGQ